MQIVRKFSKLTYSHAIGTSHPRLLQNTIGKQLLEAANKHAGQVAVISVHQNKHLTYQELFVKSKQIAANLREMGINQGQKVGVYFSNSMEWYLLQMACALSNNILVTINPAYKHEDLKHCLNSVKIDVLVTSNVTKPARMLDNVEWLFGEDQQQDKFNLKLSSVPTLKKILVVDFENKPTLNPLFFDFEETLLKNIPSEIYLTEIKKLLHENFQDEVTNIQFTSGTTGYPKGAMLTHTNILNNGFLLGHEMKYGTMDRICVPVPLYHCFGMVIGNLAAMTHGSTVIYPGFSFNANNALDSIEEYQATGLYGVPTMFLEMIKQQNLKPRNLTSLEKGVIAGSLCPEKLLLKIQNDLHVKFIGVAYGMTETSPISYLTRREDSIEKQTQTVGRILPHMEGKVVDESGETLPIGHKGEYIIKGHSVMKGYFGNPEATSQSIIEGWMYTGDLATMDEYGYLRIVGRKKDIINRGGEKIAPKEVEEYILEMDNVENVQVVSVPDENFGEEILALITIVDTKKQFDILSVKTFLKDKIAHYKIPKYVWVVNNLAITGTGKPQKFKMRKDFLAQIEELGTAESFTIR